MYIGRASTRQALFPSSVKRLLLRYLDSKTTPVNVIAKEEVVCVGQLATNFKYLHEVILWDLGQGVHEHRGNAASASSHIVRVYHQQLCKKFQLSRRMRTSRVTHQSRDSSLLTRSGLPPAYPYIAGVSSKPVPRSGDPRVESVRARIRDLVFGVHGGHSSRIAHRLDETSQAGEPAQEDCALSSRERQDGVDDVHSFRVAHKYREVCRPQRLCSFPGSDVVHSGCG